ncbi:polysaccharide deacetylase family protein [Botrimarina mediterranea]|uniref:Peptidoglycan deacetylase n=1 Tax=Botrimarina mediterranea TaxID=2528022 RepID=A0A518K6H3_9BACT|nr:polysaccharide deacetylase family protein [Botrimarina mediterranea]QDV73380.1 Peptidoglycan deacetylase [Botrimarina mediterranea]QDV77897.1 Peptidoglycan deacetylase [Planctomycetes bacterium K2D]
MQLASLSLDLDDKWAYLRSRGDAAWQARPSYLPEVTPRIVDFLGERGLQCTFFVVGEDAARHEGAREVERIADAGFEVANHGEQHLPWLDKMPADELEAEVAAAEEAIYNVTGQRPIGFRAPGFSWSAELLELLVRRGYRYDASVFPTFVGPAARLYVKLSGFRAAKPQAADQTPVQRFSSLGDALRTLRPHRIETPAGSIVELPVTTMPISRAPIHFTYVSFLAQKSPAAARAYWRAAMRLCRVRNVGPSLLLHPLDFLGEEDELQLAYFPGMRLTRSVKLQLLSDVLADLAYNRQVVTIAEHAVGPTWVRTETSSRELVRMGRG